MTRSIEMSVPVRITLPGNGGRTFAWRPADLALVAVALGAALRVRAWWLNRPLWLDEQMISMNIRDRGFANLTGALADNQAAPLGWLWAQRSVVAVLGTDERALRLLPLGFGIGTLIVGWLIGRRWLGGVGSTALVLLLAANPALLRYSAEVKQYSSDAFWVLSLVGLAGWVVTEPSALRRHYLWWAVACAGSFFSMAAILVAPGLALVLVGAALRRAGPRFALLASVGATYWLVGFAAHYLLSLRFTLANPYLQQFWDSIGYPPPGAGPARLVEWVVGQLAAVAKDPLHASASGPLPLALLLWLLAGAGVVVAARREPAYGLVLAAPLVSAVLLGLLRVVPLASRLALWLVPVFFLAVAAAVQAAASAAGHALRGADDVGERLRAGALGGAVAAALGLLALAFAGPAVAAARAPAPSVDDRAAIRYLLAEHRPGDLTLLVVSSIRARQWYAPGPELEPVRAAAPAAPGPGCDPAELARVTAGYQRALAYTGLRYYPYRDADVVLRARLSELGSVEEHRLGGGDSIVYVVDLTAPPTTPGPGVTSSALSCVHIM